MGQKMYSPLRNFVLGLLIFGMYPAVSLSDDLGSRVEESSTDSRWSFRKTDPTLAGEAQQAIKEIQGQCSEPVQSAQIDRVSKLFQKVLTGFDQREEWPAPLVLGCEEVNALSFTEARQVVVFKGLLDLNLDDGELSFILAHEVAHHLNLPEQIRETESLRESMFYDQVTKLRVNCERALKGLPAQEAQAGLERCKGVVQTWRKMNAGLYSQDVEQFVDESALKVLQRLGFKPDASLSAMTKISAEERMQRPEISELIETAWPDSFRSHPPAWKRLEYLRLQISFLPK